MLRKFSCRCQRSCISYFIGLCIWMIAGIFISIKKFEITRYLLPSILILFTQNETIPNPYEITILSPDTTSKREGVQRCRIPTFDAKHPQILPFLEFNEKNAKSLQLKGRIENGSLKLKLKNVTFAHFCYLKRQGDTNFEKTKVIDLMASENRKTLGCIESTQESCVVRIKENELQCISGMCHRDTIEIDKDAFYLQARGNIIHKASGKCLFSFGCAETNTAYKNKEIFHNVIGLNSSYLCQKECKLHLKCKAWTYSNEEKNCSFYENPGEKIYDVKGFECGPRQCTDENFRLLVSADENVCNTFWSTFEFTESLGKLKHLATLTCISVLPTGIVTLADCYSDEAYLKLTEKRDMDIDISYPLTEEHVKLDYQTLGSSSKSEYLSHVIKDDLKFNVTKRKNDDELNIMMLMFDAQSHKNIERQFASTYSYLKQDPYTVILNNHVITGDGTTANLCPMLTGKYVADLPEARPWRKKSSHYLDDWPLIFKDFQKKGYVTLYGDDDPKFGALHYRLKGFQSQPTDKYLLPFFNATKCDEESCHQYLYDYLRKFIDTYSSYKYFSFTSLSKLGHEELNSIRYGDNHTYNFIKSLFENEKYRQNTVFFIFGDHGHRSAAFRKTVWGKLEERLPFMSITLPPWFHEKLKEKVSFLKLNSNVLTSHFDIYQTLLHLLNISSSTMRNEDSNNSSNNSLHSSKRNKFGRSLFTDIAKLNRTCNEAGVPIHFCPCTEYSIVDKNDSFVVNLCMETINHINDIIKNTTINNKSACAELMLKEIIRVRKAAPNGKLLTFSDTYEIKKCDRCGIRESNDYILEASQYEIVFLVEPSQGMFEATVEYLNNTNTIRVHPEISRINRYGDQPKCIRERFPHLRKYCFCNK